jgi:hypothetical protein
MSPDTLEWTFGGLWLGAIVFIWLVYFQQLEGNTGPSIWGPFSMGSAFFIGFMAMILFMIAMAWIQFQRRLHQYQEVTREI